MSGRKRRTFFIMTCQSVTDGYIIKTASILAVKIVLPNTLLIKTPTQCQTPPTIGGQSIGEDQHCVLSFKSFRILK